MAQKRPAKRNGKKFRKVRSLCYATPRGGIRQ